MYHWQPKRQYLFHVLLFFIQAIFFNQNYTGAIQTLKSHCFSQIAYVQAYRMPTCLIPHKYKTHLNYIFPQTEAHFTEFGSLHVFMLTNYKTQTP